MSDFEVVCPRAHEYPIHLMVMPDILKTICESRKGTSNMLVRCEIYQSYSVSEKGGVVTARR